MRPARTLVVDDEPQLLDVLKEYLSKRGHHVETAPNGETALAAVARARPEVVLLDLHMPGMNGLELLLRDARGEDRASGGCAEPPLLMASLLRSVQVCRGRVARTTPRKARSAGRSSPARQASASSVHDVGPCNGR